MDSALPQCCLLCVLFFFNDTATTEIYTLSLHDALPICPSPSQEVALQELLAELRKRLSPEERDLAEQRAQLLRSEEHTSELQSPDHLVCRLLLEKKNRRLIACPDGDSAGKSHFVS